jgi:lysophospholipase L1-like esterase
MCIERSIVSLGDERYPGRLFEYIKSHGELTAVCLGGSITQGCHASAEDRRYVNLFTACLEKKFPGVKINMINAGIGATTSQFGCARVRSQVLSHKPQLVVVDFSVNDSSDEVFKSTYESLIRVLLSDSDVMWVITLNNTFFDRRVGAAAEHQKIAAHYSLSIVDCAKVFLPLIEQGRYQPLELSTDYLHPTDIGHSMIAQMLEELLDQALQRFKNSAGASFEKPSVPMPLTECGYENCEMLDNKRLAPELSGFAADLSSDHPFHDPFKNGWTGFKTGDSIAFEACFRKLLVQWRRTPRRPAPCAQVIIDGKYDEPAVLDAAFEEDWGDLSCVSLVAEYDKCETHSVSLDITKEAGNEPFMVMSFIICK